jgi:hypothetical protein
MFAWMAANNRPKRSAAVRLADPGAGSRSRMSRKTTRIVWPFEDRVELGGELAEDR